MSNLRTVPENVMVSVGLLPTAAVGMDLNDTSSDDALGGSEVSTEARPVDVR